MSLAPVPLVLERLRAGRCIILVDDESRENEGDIVCCTEFVTADIVSWLADVARGLTCVTLEQERAERLRIPLQVRQNGSPFQTAFTVTLDHREVRAAGVTAASRAFSMRQLVNPAASAEDFVSPGHVFPLIANPAGVFGRRGQTEGSVDLARLAGAVPSGVICEILNPDGTMCRGDDLYRFAQQHDLPVTSIEAIVAYRMQYEVRVRETGRSEVTTDWGPFTAISYFDDTTQREHLALVRGDYSRQLPLVRIHSECLTGDVFGSRRCDCGDQLAMACSQIREHVVGAIVYLRQEGRGIGLGNKIRAYELQDAGHDTVAANELLGFPADARTYAVASSILRALNIAEFKLMTNNPAKVEAMRELGFQIAERVPLVVPADEYSREYLRVKRDRFGHLL